MRRRHGKPINTRYSPRAFCPSVAERLPPLRVYLFQSQPKLRGRLDDTLLETVLPDAEDDSTGFQ